MTPLAKYRPPGHVGVLLWILPAQREALNRVCQQRGANQSALLRPYIEEAIARMEYQEMEGNHPGRRCDRCEDIIPLDEPVLDGLCLPCYATQRKAALVKQSTG